MDDRKFQSTRPHGGATEQIADVYRLRKFQSTRPHGGATSPYSTPSMSLAISIHAPAWGRDAASRVVHLAVVNFNPRARMGARRSFFVFLSRYLRFQSTRPHGGATLHDGVWCGTNADFNPRARMGARLARDAVGVLDMCISIHAPAWGRDVIFIFFRPKRSGFQSTRPHGGATSAP